MSTETQTPELDVALLRSGFAAMRRTFRGEIWEDDADVPMGKGYRNDGKPFDIRTANYLRAPMQAIRNPIKRKMVIKAAVQTLKTYACIEKPASYFIKHDPGDMTIYDCDLAAANDHAKSRLGPLLRSVPGIQAQISEVQSRHDVATCEFYLPGMTLRIWPLNESSTQRITLRYVFISDAFLSGKSGMIKQAIARATQHPHDKKIIIESQGSEEGDDFDQEWKETDQAELNVRCPWCEQLQPFIWSRDRESDFLAVHAKAGTPHITQPKAGMIAGFQRGPENLVLFPDGSLNEPEIIRHTHYECYFCGGRWEDRPDIRARLDESSTYVATNPGALPSVAGFTWPAWINRRLGWGDLMLEYLRARHADKQFGNRGPYQIWTQKRAALQWSDKHLAVKARIITASTGDEGVPNEVARMMTADCQQADDVHAQLGQSILSAYWCVAWAVDRSGNIFQLARFYTTSRAEVHKNRKFLKIGIKNLAWDGGNWLDEIVTLVAGEYEEGVELDRRGRPIKVRKVAKVLRGNGTRKSWKWPDNIWRPFAPPSYMQRRVEVKPKQFAVIDVPIYEWSNLSIKDQLDAIYRGGPGRARLTILPREKLDPVTQSMEVGDRVYERQIMNESRTSENGKSIWKETNPNVHYKDCDAMGLVLGGLGGLFGQAMAPDENTNVS